MRNMRRMIGTALLFAGMVALVGTSVAAQRGRENTLNGSAVVRANGPRKVTPKQLDQTAARIQAATAIVDRLQAEAVARGLSAGWRQATFETLLPLSRAALERLSQETLTLDSLAAAAVEAGEDPNLIGDPNADLTYTPTAPCRFIDTRNVGGKISGVRAFDVDLTGAAYGGIAACNPTVLFGSVGDGIGALAMNVTIFDTSTAGAPGFAAVKPDAGAPVTSLLNWYEVGATVQVANQGIVTLNQTGGVDPEFVIQTSGAVHVIVDIFGAFIEPEATPLQITNPTTPWSITTGSFSVTVACPAGYTIVGGGWNHNGGHFDGISATQSSAEGNSWRCRGWFTGPAGSTQSGTCEAVCARVPGR